MTTQGIEFRTGTPADAEGIARVTAVFAKVFAEIGHAQMQLQQFRDEAHEWRVGVRDGEIISAVHASPSTMWFGRSQLRWADIGDVSVLESLQGAGIGSLAMRDMATWLRETGCGVSRLGGLMRFYSRAGYEPFPRCYVEFPVSEVIRAGTSEVPFTDLLQPAFPGAGQVRPFNEARDIPQIWHVMDTFTRYRTGCRTFVQPTSTPETLHGSYVYEIEGQARGVVIFREFEKDVSPFEASLTIYQLWYQPGYPAALDGLIKHVLGLAHAKKAHRVTAFIPFSDDVTHDLLRLGVGYTLCEIMGAVAGNMIQVGSLRALLEQLQPELQRRIEGLRWQGNITFDIGDQQATLLVSPDTVEVSEAVESRYRLRLSHAELVRAVLGILPPVWSRLLPPADDIWPTINAMFPPVRGGYNS